MGEISASEIMDDLIKHCLAELSEWENNFIQSCFEQDGVSAKQLKILRDLEDKYL